MTLSNVIVDGTTNRIQIPREGIFLLSSGMDGSKLTSHIAEILQLNINRLAIVRDIGSFVTDGFHNLSVDKSVNAEPGLFRLPVRRLEVAVTTLEARSIAAGGLSQTWIPSR
jgi:hypothetical protein